MRQVSEGLQHLRLGKCLSSPRLLHIYLTLHLHLLRRLRRVVRNDGLTLRTTEMQEQEQGNLPEEMQVRGYPPFRSLCKFCDPATRTLLHTLMATNLGAVQ